eukprot:CAMPEP_0182928600 /NCGR_PEP_ID=MMETSP0105_2-20130417/15672_1 /TAXON_ID=81532 ORGANISM="Acanthoeca-like sp., Strain 10tr" /NCGR_SAMPLE_ID=MMETSP0105_2 /ASSEMBLY_ACC=CAM_ASM_000205 /LENGTH=275 /DNA_ID=CAMNT_0025066605 /DNA_START=1 /DNA_END=828 /DNA_ORIENTATION=+
MAAAGRQPVRPQPAGSEVAQPDDPHVKKLRKYQTWQVAYCRDMVKVLHHSLAPRGVPHGAVMVGRAYTVTGTDIYLNALESIGPGEVFVQGGCDDTHAVFSPGWTHAYLAPRGAVGVVTDGGVCKLAQCSDAACPVFSRFASPSFAINRQATALGKPTTIGGQVVNPGDIIMGDTDGVIVIPKEKEDEFFQKFDAFMKGNANFGRIAGAALAKGTPLTEEPALADMFGRKYKNPDAYWREYEGWWAEWELKLGKGDLSEGTVAFYSGKDSEGTPK